MKFAYKIVLWTIIIMAVAFGISGYTFINFVFDKSLEREVNQAMNDTNIMQFAFQTAALNIPSKYEVLQDRAIEQIGANLDVDDSGKTRRLRISDENREVLYASEGFVEEKDFLEQIAQNSRIYRVIRVEDRFFVHTGTVIHALDRLIYLETMKDITEVYDERTRGFAVYRRVTWIVLVLSGVVMYFISFWLTKPIRLLTRATKKMADGDYGYRLKQVSNDEMGHLTEDFNRMAGALEENVKCLEEELHAREDFIAAFSHELKTPLTAIIGYADLLRSRKLDEEKALMSANYIYTEGRRLEAMAFRLLDLIVTKRGEIEFRPVSAEEVFSYVKNLYSVPREDAMVFEFVWDAGELFTEQNLLVTVLTNLIDNACKASKPGSPVQITGQKREDGYHIAVKDSGVGISKEECSHITEAFYMVDKSRSRQKNGAGLGLTLCVEILKLHHSVLEIESTQGVGSCFGFLLPGKEMWAEDAQ